MILGLMSGAFGLVLSTIGMDPMEGVERFMFGQDALYNGVNITGALIGLFSPIPGFHPCGKKPLSNGLGPLTLMIPSS